MIHFICFLPGGSPVVRFIRKVEVWTQVRYKEYLNYHLYGIDLLRKTYAPKEMESNTIPCVSYHIRIIRPIWVAEESISASKQCETHEINKGSQISTLMTFDCFLKFQFNVSYLCVLPMIMDDSV